MIRLFFILLCSLFFTTKIFGHDWDVYLKLKFDQNIDKKERYFKTVLNGDVYVVINNVKKKIDSKNILIFTRYGNEYHITIRSNSNETFEKNAQFRDEFNNRIISNKKTLNNIIPIEHSIKKSAGTTKGKDHYGNSSPGRIKFFIPIQLIPINENNPPINILLAIGHGRYKKAKWLVFGLHSVSYNDWYFALENKNYNCLSKIGVENNDKNHTLYWIYGGDYSFGDCPSVTKTKYLFTLNSTFHKSNEFTLTISK